MRQYNRFEKNIGEDYLIFKAYSMYTIKKFSFRQGDNIRLVHYITVAVNIIGEAVPRFDTDKFRTRKRPKKKVFKG